MKRSNYFLIVVFLLFVCTSLFAQWTTQNSGIPTGDQVVLAAVDTNVCWGVTRVNSVRYVTRTTNGGVNWVASNLNSLNDFYDIAALNADTAWIAADGAVYKTTNGGVNWTQQSATGMIIRFFDSNNGVCVGFLGIGNSEIYTTTNGGSLWTPVPSSNIPDPVNGEGFIPANAWVVGNTIWVPTNGNFAFPGSLYKSTDRGITWNVTRPINDQSGFFCAFKDSLNGLLSSSFNNLVKRTTDGGATWTNTASIPAGVTPFLIAYVPGSSGSYVITSFTLFTQIPGSAYTLDNGATWTTVDNVLHGRAAFVSPSTGWSWGGANVIYKWTPPPVLPVELTSFTAHAQDQTVILSWVTATEINNRGFEIQRKVLESDFATVGFVKGEGTTTNQKEYSYADKNLAEGKYFYRLMQLDFNGEYEYSKTIEVDVRSLANFTLEQNYPNPFNPSTKISWQSPVGSWQVLRVFDVLGNEVATLVDEYKPAGSYEVNFDAASLPSGVYLYKLQSGSFVETKKLMLLK